MSSDGDPVSVPDNYFRIELRKHPVPHAKASFRFTEGAFEVAHEIDLNDREYTVLVELSRSIIRRYMAANTRKNQNQGR